MMEAVVILHHHQKVDARIQIFKSSSLRLIRIFHLQFANLFGIHMN